MIRKLSETAAVFCYVQKEVRCPVQIDLSWLNIVHGRETDIITAYFLLISEPVVHGRLTAVCKSTTSLTDPAVVHRG